MARDVVYLWGGRRPERSELQRRTRASLQVVRAEPDALRSVKPRKGPRVELNVQAVLDKVLASSDMRRWEVIPAIIPTLRSASEVYRKQTPRGRTAYSYFATLPSHRPTEPRGRHDERTFAVHAIQDPGAACPVFASVYCVEERKVAKTKQKAGVLLNPRLSEPNGAWATRERRRTVDRLPGAASARTEQSTPWPLIAAIAGGVLLLDRALRRHQLQEAA